ncbi:MAG TPA: CPBP family intramembrane glutamic endopeptidase [Candidatus Angelobacter sp.]|nr:CPBP family intramembrane glutamic endopeptidase [Candidatus Angelobacter sp.]
MDNDPQQPANANIYSAGSTMDQPSVSKPALIAPLWHTLLIAALILANSFLGSSKLGAVQGSGSRILLYAGTFITQLVLILLIWFGIRLRGVRMRDLIGGRWKTPEDFLLDVGLAIGFLIVALLLLFLVRVALGTIDLHNLQKSKDDAVKMFALLAPHTYLEAGLFVLLSISAGLFEEIIFRGYLQRQLGALGQNAVIGIVGSGILFGLAHGYQGKRMMVAIGVFGVFFGIMAYLRKSLRPGMIAHAMQDSIAGITLFTAVKEVLKH